MPSAAGGPPATADANANHDDVTSVWS